MRKNNFPLIMKVLAIIFLAAGLYIYFQKKDLQLTEVAFLMVIICLMLAKR